MNWLSNPSMVALDKGLSGLWQRQRAINDNIANMSTPGYKRKQVNFEDSLGREVERLSRGAVARGERQSRIAEVEIKASRDLQTTIKEDGNNVDVDQEFNELLRTGLQYQYTQRLLNDEISRLRYAITEGRG